MSHHGAFRFLPAFALFWVLAALGLSHAAPARGASAAVSRTIYHGWPDSLLMRNGKVESIVVPAIGRVMQFRFAGGGEDTFWENRAMDGKQPDSKATEWGNFGGDKTWPSPQGDWPRVANRGWPPPPAFDSVPVTAEIQGDQVLLTSAVDPFYGIRTTRRIKLEAENPVMSISTTYEKVTGEPRKVGVWVITQLRDPVGVYLMVPSPSRYPDGYNKLSDQSPPSLKRVDGLRSLTRDRSHSFKIGSEAGTLFWVGEKTMVRIDSARIADAEYPDQASSAEVYTNPDPLPYVELEMLGPLSTLRVGDKIERTNTYTLYRRSGGDPAVEVRELLRR